MLSTARIAKTMKVSAQTVRAIIRIRTHGVALRRHISKVCTLYIHSFTHIHNIICTCMQNLYTQYELWQSTVHTKYWKTHTWVCIYSNMCINYACMCVCINVCIHVTMAHHRRIPRLHVKSTRCICCMCMCTCIFFIPLCLVFVCMCVRHNCRM